MSDDITSTIRNALRSLDVADDREWTAGGLPAMDAVRMLAGETVTRRMVEDAAPGFCRGNTALPGEMVVSIGDDWAGQSPSERAARAADVVRVEPTPEPEGGTGAPPADVAAILRAKIADLGEAHRLLSADIKAAKKRNDQIVADMDAAQRELDKLNPPETFSQQYQRVMAQSIKDRAARAEALRNAPPAPLSVKSPLDQAYAARRRI